MGIIEERRRLITNEMEAGRGSEKVYSGPVPLEPPFRPFNLRVERPSLLGRMLGWTKEEPLLPPIGPSVKGRLRFIRIKPSREDDNTIDVAERLIISLPATAPVGFEIIVQAGKISFQVASPEGQADQVASQLRAHFPGADVYPDADLVERGLFSSHVVARTYRLKSSHFLPLTPVADKAFEPYRMLFGCLSNIGQGQVGGLQILFTPVKSDWQENMRKASRNPYDPGQSPFVDLPQLPKSVDKKLTRPLYAVSIRIFASNETLLVMLEQFLKQFENTENSIIPTAGTYPVKSIIERSSHVHGCILNSTELGYILHLPSTNLMDSMQSVEQAVRSYPVPNEFTADGPVLGINTHRGMRRTVRHSPNLPNRHVYVSGKSGYGKSNELLQTAVQRIERGDGVGIIDPHGSLIREGILPRIPKERIADVVYLNAGDFEHPMAINPMAHSGAKLEKEHIRVDLLNFFEDLFEAPLGVNIQHALNFFIVSLLTRRDSTLSDIERLLLDKSWRNVLIESIDDERVRMFWEHEYPQLEKRGIITAITNKLSPLILPDSTIAPMLKQRENRLDFLKIMDGKKIFLCNLSHGDIGKRNSQLLGKLLVSKLQIAAMMREGNGTSPDFYLYIDEFQHMVCPSMADILSGARKYGLHLWLTNQMTGDIPESIMRHVFNASTLIFFASDSPSDQTLIEKNLSKKFKAEDIGQLKRGETFVKMVGGAFNMMTERVPSLPPVQWVDEIIAASRAKYTTAPDYKEERFKRPEPAPKPENGHPMPKEEHRATASFMRLSFQEKAFLECAYHKPMLSITGLYQEQGISAYMGDKLKRSLMDKELIHEVKTHLGGKARIAKFLLLTPTGFSAIGVEFGRGEGKGGPLHRYWQSVIKFHAEAKGYKAVIEDLVSENDEMADLGLERDGQRIAIEISITTRVEHELGNARKCLNAGYEKVVVFLLEEDKLAEFQGHCVKSFADEERARLSSGLVYDFGSFL